MSEQLQIPFDKRKRKPRPVVSLDTSALTNEIIRHIRKLGGWAVRVNVSGFYDPEKGFWRKGVTDPGTPDIMAVVNGRFYGIEIKTGTDRLRPEQTLTKQAIEGAGGVFLIAHDIAKFREEFRAKILQHGE
jgi:Holliday junction resolvase